MSSYRPRRNSEVDDHRYSSTQHNTRHGPVPSSSVRREAERASAYPAGQPGRSGFPHEYRNSEGPATAPRRIFDGLDTRGGRPMEEYPVGLPRQADRFDYDRPSAKAKKVDRPVPPAQRAAAVGAAYPGAAAWPGARTAAPNDPGPLRAAGVRRPDASLTAAGLMQHPAGNMRGFEAVPREPIDRDGRRAADRVRDDRDMRGASSYPPRYASSTELYDREKRYRKR